MSVGRYLIYFIFLSNSFVIAQSFLPLKGKIVDETTKEPIPYAAILLKGTSTSTISDGDGNFEIISKNKTTTVIVYRIGYFTKEINIEKEKYENALITLKRKAVNLIEVDVVAKKIDTLQYKTKTVCAAFEFYDNYIVALVNKGNAFNFVQVMEDDGTIVKEKKAPKDVEQLYKDCFGNVQLVSKDSTYQFYYDYEKIIYQKPYSLNEFRAKVLPCQCAAKDFVYFKEERFKRLRHIYYYINLNTPDKKHVIAEVADNDAISTVKKYMDISYFLAQRRAGVAQYGTSVDEITKHLEEMQEKAPLTGKLAGTIFPIFSTMVKKDSAVFIVDYFHKKINKYNFLGGFVKADTISLSYLKPGILEDTEGNVFYFVKEEDGISNLYEYNEYKVGYKVKSIKEFKFVKNLRCRNGTAYFIFRDPLSGNNGLKIYKYRL